MILGAEENSSSYFILEINNIPFLPGKEVIQHATKTTFALVQIH